MRRPQIRFALQQQLFLLRCFLLCGLLFHWHGYVPPCGTFSLGLQSPRIGYSSYRGAQTATPRYWAELLLVSIEISPKRNIKSKISTTDSTDGARVSRIFLFLFFDFSVAHGLSVQSVTSVKSVVKLLLFELQNARAPIIASDGRSG